MIDEDGYRPNVGIILLNNKNKVFWGRRKGENSWQFPQGGIYDSELPDEAMHRELNEELGLSKEHIEILAKTSNWLYYNVPDIYNRSKNPHYKGQKQIWYLLKFIGEDYHINVKYHKEQEFDAWRWVDYWIPINEVITFKQNVYQEALNQLSNFLNEIKL